jgi:class 3 adenylate cyclase
MDLNAPAVIDRALMAAYRRQQELSWIEQLVEDIEAAVEETGGLGRPEWVPAMCFLDLVGYTRLTEEHGDQVAAELAEASRVLVSERVAERTPPQGVTFVELGQVQLQGIARPVPLLEAHRA